MPAEFLAENNLCGQTILHLVSRGNAIIAELLRLKDHIPPIFRLSTKNDQQKYAEIINDFTYFKIEEYQNDKIENNDTLHTLDDEFKEHHIELIVRFYLAFESIFTYINDLKHFLTELDDGIYIHQNIETVFTDIEGKQLLCEALFLYGLMLFTLDKHIPGPIRERLLVSYYRYMPQRGEIDDVCKLLRETGLHSPKKPQNYPQDFFQRVEISRTYIDIVIGHLRTGDIYDQITAYPLPKHRSHALAQQASMLYICLYFSPNTLQNQTAVMREIVDKYFPDNWTISLYMGHVVNLIDAWEPFKAAKMALNNTIETINVKSYSAIYAKNLQLLLKATESKLNDENLSKETILKDINKIIGLLRECNCTIQWLMLHYPLQPPKFGEKNKKLKQLREIIINETGPNLNSNLFKLLLNTAQLELATRDTYKSLLNNRQVRFGELKSESSKSLVELAEVFSGSKPLNRVKSNKKLQEWFIEIGTEIDSLELDNQNSSRKLVQLIQALEEVQEYHNLGENMQIVQYLNETRTFLHQMIRILSINEGCLITLQIITDLSYAWNLIDLFTPIMQENIKVEPGMVSELRAIFLKLASAMEVPLLRINQTKSEDFESVSQFFSSELEAYIRKVLQIIPVQMFEKMARIIQMQTTTFKELPARLDKDKLREFAQLEQRFEFAQLTSSIAVFSQGMRMMKTTLVGVICLDPKQLLEDGIRKELVACIASSLHSTLIFSQKFKRDEFNEKLATLSKIMAGYKRSFEYIQDYISLNGLLIWQQEVGRIINYNVEQECNKFLRNKSSSEFQNKYIPIPIYAAIDADSNNFIGRLAREIIRQTDPRHTWFVEQESSWFDNKTRKVVFNKEAIALIGSAIEIPGLVGLDRFFSFVIVISLQKIGALLECRNGSITWKNIVSLLQSEVKSPGFVDNMENPIRLYQNCVNRTSKNWGEFLDAVLLVGQLQILRKLISFHLNNTSKLCAKGLESSLQALNDSLLKDIVHEKLSPDEGFLEKVANCFNYIGLNNPYNKIYITMRFDVNHAILLFIFVIAHLNKCFFLFPISRNRKRNADLIDSTAFTIAIHTIIKQFHTLVNVNFIKFLSIYINQLVNQKTSGKTSEFPPETDYALTFLEHYVTYSQFSRKIKREVFADEIGHILHMLLGPI